MRKYEILVIVLETSDDFCSFCCNSARVKRRFVIKINIYRINQNKKKFINYITFDTMEIKRYFLFQCQIGIFQLIILILTTDNEILARNRNQNGFKHLKVICIPATVVSCLTSLNT